MKKITLLFFLMSISLIYAQPPAEGGAEFNGSDEYIPVPDTDNINTTSVSNRTIETYFKVDNGTNRQVLFEEGGGVNALLLYIESGFIHAGIFRNDGGTGNSIFFRKAISDNTWYHVALVLDNSSTLSFYLDGVLQDTRTGAFAVPQHSGNINLGRSDTNLRYPTCATWTTAGSSEYCLDNVTNKINANYYFAGHVWGFRIWDVVRTGAEINDNKDMLITDTSTAPGDDLLAFLDDDFDSITYKASDDSYQTADGVFNTLSNENFDLKSSIRIFVKNDFLKVSIPNNSILEQMNIYSLDGKNVLTLNYNNPISVSGLSRGLYLVRMKFDSGIVTKKIIL